MSKTLTQSVEQQLKDSLSNIFCAHPKIREVKLSGEGVRRYFPNKMRCDFYYYKEKSVGILRFNRGAWMVRQEPMLGLLFDQVEKVIAKIYLYDIETIQKKAISSLISRVANYPSGISCYSS